MELLFCPRCNRHAETPSNRLITEKCGHVKCRECFISDLSGCYECSQGRAGLPLEQEPPHLPADSQNIPTPIEADSFEDFGSDSGELCIDTEVDDSTTFDGPVAAKRVQPTDPDVLPETANNINTIHNYSTQETNEERNASAESLKILEQYIIPPKTKIEQFFRATKSSSTSAKVSSPRHAERKKSLPDHVTRVEENGESFYKCSKCGKKFRSRNQQYYHAYCGNDDSKPHKCKVCSKNFSTSSHLNYHLKTHNDTGKYPCNQCSKTFMRSISLKSHKRIHEGIFRFTCQDCGLGFNEKKSFAAHMNKHKNIMPFTCSVCEKRFSFKSNLTQHEKIHTGLGKRFQCNDCGKEFLRKNSYKEHLIRHSKIKKFQCKLCHTFFINRNTLERHMNTHDSKVYKCPCCDVKCSRRDNLVRHVRNMHQSEYQAGILKNIKPVTSRGDDSKENDSPLDSPHVATTVTREIELPVESQQQIVVSTSVIRSVGNVKPVCIPSERDLQMSPIRTETNAPRLGSTNNNLNKGNTDNHNQRTSAVTTIDTKKPKKKYDPCEIYRKILFANDADDSVLESEELYSDSKDDHIGCCNADNNSTFVSAPTAIAVSNEDASNVPSEPSNFAEIHWRKRTSQSFYTSL